MTNRLEELRSKRCAVIGLGVSNRPLIEFLLSHGASLTARDRKERCELEPYATELEARGVTCYFGDAYLSSLSEELIFRTPGIRPDLPPFLEAVGRGARITSEMELFLELTPATVIGITGSDGKTTTTTLVDLFLQAECDRVGKGRSYVGGNIGTPLLPLVEQMTAEDYAVVELSSFQLMGLLRSPHRAAITNLSPNHLDWHRGMEEYGEAKTHIFRHAPNQLLVTNAENQAALELARDCRSPITLFSSLREPGDLPQHKGSCVFLRNGMITVQEGEQEIPVLAAEEIRLLGRHNLENYMTAIALTWGLVSFESIATVAREFEGVPHRLEPVRVFEGVSYYNSSIDSTPSRTAAALSALSGKPIVICGGYDKKLSYDPLAETLNQRAKAVVLTGASADTIAAALARSGGDLKVVRAACFEEAVHLARELAQEGDTVLLSPACASFDAFRDYKERGNTFRRIVESFR